MKKFDLFKTKEEKRAYAIGRRHQYNKEHPLTNYVVRAKHYTFEKDGSMRGTPYTTDGSRHRFAKEAQKECREANERARIHKERVLAAVKKKKVNTYNSQDCSYTTYEVVKERKRL